MDGAGFTGFGDKALPFLKALAFHQNKEWFAENRALYDSDVKRPMGDFIDAASARFAHLGIPLHGNRTGSMFRVNRDVRFAKDKHPYNTHASAVLTRNGTKKDSSGAYIHIKPGECYVGAGIWMTEAPVLNALRRKILAFPETFLAIEDELRAKGAALSVEGEMKRVPADYKSVTDPRLQALLRKRHFFINRPVPDEAVVTPAVLEALVETTMAAGALFAFFWPVIDETPAQPA